MRLHGFLPADRTRLGHLQVEDDLGVPILGPWPCYGKADNLAAQRHGNPQRLRVFPFGDHPLGLYRLTSIVADQPGFGPFFYGLEPVDGEALEAVVQGLRHGLAIHGGRLRPDGTMRPTYGCLRVHDATTEALHQVVVVGMAYLCEQSNQGGAP